MKNNISFIFFLFIAISSISYKKGFSIDVYDTILFSLLSIILIILYPIKKIDIFSFLFISGCITSTFLSSINPTSIFMLINIFLALNVIEIVKENYENIKYVYEAILISIGLNLIILFFQIIGFSPIIENKSLFGAVPEPGGLFGNAPRLCLYIAISLPIIFYKNKYLSIIISSLGIALGEIYLPVFCLILFIESLNKKYKYFFYIVILLIAFIFLHDKITSSFVSRETLWKSTIEQIFNKPIFGHGLGMFPILSNKFISGEYKNETAMSSFLQFIFSVGFVGLAGIISCVFIYIKENRKKYCYARWWPPVVNKTKENPFNIAILFLLLLSIIEYPFEVPKLWFLICIIMGGWLYYERH